METVEPIRDKAAIDMIKRNLASKPRDFLLFTMGINTALRIGDLLSLKVKDVCDDHGVIRNVFYIRTGKTNRELKIMINESMRAALDRYFDHVGRDVPPDTYLFRSTQGRNNHPLTKTGAWQLVKNWTRDVGLDEERYGCHSLRKTWGYWARKQGIDISLISEKLGHTSPGVTRRYLGISQEEINDVEMQVNL